MNTQQTIIELADSRVLEAEHLCAGGFYDYAYYTAGYGVELYLKVRICNVLNMPNFFDFGNRTKFVNEDTITKPYKVHNFEQLLILAGLFPEHEKMMLNKNYGNDWYLLRLWKEDLRYNIGKTENDVNLFVNSVRNYITWIKKHL